MENLACMLYGVGDLMVGDGIDDDLICEAEHLLDIAEQYPSDESLLDASNRLRRLIKSSSQ